MEEKGVPNGAKHVHKRAHGDTYDGKIATLSRNENVDKTLCFTLLLKPWAPIYEPCWVILGSCCRPMHALMCHRKMVTQPSLPLRKNGEGGRKRGSQMVPNTSTNVPMGTHMTAKLRHCPKMKMLKKRCVLHYF